MKALRFIILVMLIALSYDGFAQNKNAVINKMEFQSTLINLKCIMKVGENHYFIDFGLDAFGTLVLCSKLEQTDTMTCHLGEKSISSNSVDREPGGTIRYQKTQLPYISANILYTIKLQADKRNTNPPAIALPDSFGVVMPFRYCELVNLKIPIENITIKQKVYTYSFNDTSSDFICSDTILNQIWKMCKYTVKATSFAGLYIDGDRERKPYEADAYINQLSHYCVDNNYSMARRTNEYFMNNPTWPTEWILHTVLLFYYDYLYTGDIEPIANHYEALKIKTLVDLEREDGLISSKSEKVTDEFMKKMGFNNTKERIRDIVDWPPAQSETGWKLATQEGERDGYEMVEMNTVVNSFHYINLKLMAEIAGYLGKKEDSTFFQNKSNAVKEAINKKMFDKRNGIYRDGENSKHSSLHANMFPLAFGIVPKEYVSSVTSFIKLRGMACSVYGAQYLLEGLYKHHEADYALELLISQSNRSWWNMIRAGSTLALEAWDMKYKPNLDWNHAWGTAPVNIITRYVWGIRPVQAGFTKVHIEPQLSNLIFSKIKVPTIKGTIKAEYKIIDHHQKLYTIELPNDMNGEFILVHTDNARIFVNNKEMKSTLSSVSLKSGLNRIELIK